MSKVLLLAVLLVFVFGLATDSQAIVVDYASQYSDSTAINPQLALGKPDGQHAMFGDDNPPYDRHATYFGFGSGDVLQYSTSSLASLFGVSESLLNSADFFATEYNGGYNTMFESGIWTFSDSSNSIAVSWDSNSPGVGGSVLAYGSIDINDYNSFFGIPAGIGYGGEWTYLLLNVSGNSGVNMYSNNFRVTLTADDSKGGGDDPDIDAMGRFQAVPEPATFLLLGLGLLGFTLKRNRPV